MSKNYEISDKQWKRIENFLPGRKGTPGRTAKNNRQFVNAVVWMLRSGARWQDLPKRYGKYKSVHKRYTNWCKSGVWERVQSLLNTDNDAEYLMLDSTVVKAHSQAATYKKKDQGLGRSVGGLSSKIHMLCDALGNPLRFIITAGQVHDVTQACELLEGQKADYVLADRGYIQPKFFEKIRSIGAKPIIPHRRNQPPNKDFDPILYKDRHLIECLFSKIKHFRRIATRFDKKLSHFAGFVSLACIMILLR